MAESWVRRVTKILDLEKFLYFVSNGELLLTMEKQGVKVYNVETEEIKDVAKTFRDQVLFRDTYVES